MDRQTRPYPVTQVELHLDVSYQGFTHAFEALLGRMNAAVVGDLRSLSPEAARARLASFVGPLDFTLFHEIDHGAVLAGIYGRSAHAITYIFGNPLIAVEMTKHDARAGLYVPLRLFVEEVVEGKARLTYDLPSSLIAQFGSPDADTVARGLDAKVQRLLDATVARARS